MLLRTQILLDEETKRDLEYLSEVKNQSISKLVRTYLSEKVRLEKKKAKRKRIKKMSGVETLLKMAESAEKLAKKYKISGPRDLSINHDHYLYGAPKKTK
ncbi:MAG: hypothetical protein US60_C0023G0006 [Microgenomates group bacterium GW2011_GWC1_37_8]|uniref:Ribbon-helix-helix protein CopG domain-containing protein n=2 Tax=Candidatus Woeseibacteriota TaxID=1752722 RepID=A0A0G0P8A6_9BACT|nr:MAG: hypothetical protein US60_C0023G0006 [Microgenomates group bacterium GW2011_GWC1_37_8]KKQ85561.1 MAG: hypothetical protein UT08_C0005G0012 [Candidatus Woesebacteria bacterium GW2011_GWB1_38_8]OGM20914.1 MAG: hypothetical protein A2863_03360 [Candidatus Woesebacteria bacterium RIFCSPHIGHO2_01_FULL_38_9b]